MGGPSSEREISLLSGQAVADGLRTAGYVVSEVCVSETAAYTLPAETDAVFIALHGTFGEDGQIQSQLEARGLPYTGSGPLASEIAFDKIRSRAAFEAVGVPVAPGWILPRDRDPGTLSLSLPVVVKPPRQGSSVGISLVKTPEALEPAVRAARVYNDDVLVEAFIPGREWTVAIIGGTAFPIIEITPKTDDAWYDWNAKYFSGGTTRYTFPEDSPDCVALAARVKTLALTAFHAVGARALARVDFRITPDGDPYALELNSIPGFTASSLVPKAAAKAGLAFPDLCRRIMEEASCG